MTLKTEDILTPRVQAVLTRPRHEAYVRKADAYVQRRFPQRFGALSSKTRLALIEAAHAASRARGMVKDADHLGYLVPVAYWGLYFETDPQHSAALERAGWFEEVPEPALLAPEIDVFREETASDLADPTQPLRTFERHFIRDAENDDADTCIRLMQRAFPARFERLSAVDAGAFVASAQRCGLARDLSGADLVAYVALALVFGHRFADDPLHDWAQNAYHDPTMLRSERRLTLGAGIRAYAQRFVPRQDGTPAEERL